MKKDNVDHTMLAIMAATLGVSMQAPLREDTRKGLKKKGEKKAVTVTPKALRKAVGSNHERVSAKRLGMTVEQYREMLTFLPLESVSIQEVIERTM